MYIRPGADGSMSSASLWLGVNARMCCLLVCGLLLPSVYEKKEHPVLYEAAVCEACRHTDLH